jgi:lysophospholipase L1-like esterase
MKDFGSDLFSIKEKVDQVDTQMEQIAKLNSNKIYEPLNLYDESLSVRGQLGGTGGLSPNPTSPYKFSAPITLIKGKKYSFTYAHPTLGRYRLSFGSRLCIYTTSNVFVTQTTTDTNITDVMDISLDSATNARVCVPKFTMNIRFQTGNDTMGIVVVQGVSNDLYIIDSMQKNMTKPLYCNLFNKGICIGDSLTEGYHTSTDIDKDRSYPKYLSNLTGWITENAGVSGITTMGWYDTYSGDYTYTDYDFAIIYLGSNGGLTDTLVADTNFADYNNYANTNTGSYCKIIEKILSANPNCKIFIVRWDGSVTSNVTQQIATKYGIDAINLLDKTWFDVTLPSLHTDATHFNSVGYLTLAKNIQNWIEYFLLSQKELYLEQ